MQSLRRLSAFSGCCTKDHSWTLQTTAACRVREFDLPWGQWETDNILFPLWGLEAADTPGWYAEWARQGSSMGDWLLWRSWYWHKARVKGQGKCESEKVWQFMCPCEGNFGPCWKNSCIYLIGNSCWAGTAAEGKAVRPVLFPLWFINFILQFKPRQIPPGVYPMASPGLAAVENTTWCHNCVQNWN